MAETVRTRFAPSPTGHLHVGGARTALFNFLLARRLGGRFLLRIEDTDQSRNVAGAERKLLDDMRWLGLTWDEGPEVGGAFGPYRQSERLEAYQEAARTLLASGRAYYAMETREELEAMRAAAQQRGERGFRYPRPERVPSEAEAQAARDEGRPVVVRFMMPERDFVIHDRILGDVEVKASELSDFVIQKADGWPTYHFAVVVDDEHMRITHVLRGQEHLLNTANHLGLQEALGYRTPEYAHLPIILNMDGSKMSKRERDKAVRAAVSGALDAGTISAERARVLSGCADDAAFAEWRGKKTQLEAEGLDRLAVELAVDMPEIEIYDFQASGYLPEVLVNFIALLGWSPGDDRERLTLDELCAAFSMERIGRTNARFDRDKLLNFNMRAASEAPIERLRSAFRDFLSANEQSPLRGSDDATLDRLLEVNRGFRTFRDVEQKCAAIFQPDDEIRFDPAAVKKVLLKGDGAGLVVLRDLRGRLAELSDWSAATIDQFLREYAEAEELGLGKVAQPLRVAVTGTTISPPIFDTLELLGREKTLTRIDRTLREVRGAD